MRREGGVAIWCSPKTSLFAVRQIIAHENSTILTNFPDTAGAFYGVRVHR